MSPPGTQWSGTQLSTPTHGGRQGKARPLGTILPFAGTRSHRGCSTASPRHMHSTCLPSYSFCKRQDLRPCLNPGSAAQAAPQHADPAWGHSSHSLPPAADANRPGAHKHPLCPASISPSQGAGTKQGPAACAGASRRPGCFSCLPPALLCLQALRNPLGTNCRQTCNPKVAYTAISQGLPRLCRSPYAALHPQQP